MTVHTRPEHIWPASGPPRPESASPQRAPRVALVSDYTLATLGGAETAFAEQAKVLAQSTEVLAVCPPSDGLSLLADSPRITVEPVPVAFVVPGLGFPVARNNARLRARLRRVFTTQRIDVVHVHTEFGIAAAAIAAARDLRLPVVHTVHTFFWQTQAPIQTLLSLGGPAYYRTMTGLRATGQRLAERPGDSALRNMTLAVARAADAVLSPSSHQAARLRAAGLPAVSVVPNTVGWNHAARPVTRVDGPLRVLWMGRFACEKRVLPFLRSAVRALQRVGPGMLQVDVVGSGPQFASATRIVEGIEGIRLHGRVPNEEIPQWLERSHVTVLSSIGWDNQPMSVAESIMALRGVVWADPELTEGLSEAGIAAFGADEGVMQDRLCALAIDPAPVIEASAAATHARRVFGEGTFTAAAMQVYQYVGAGAGAPPTHRVR